MKKLSMGVYIFCLLSFLCVTTVACSKKKTEDDVLTKKNDIIIGFSQIGAESAWRTRNTESIKSAAAEAGIQLLYNNAEQKQENQIKALRSFIAYQVDVIIFVPIVEDGWDNVLIEAKEAEIPVIICDRKMQVKDESLYAGFVGADSDEEGKKAANFIIQKFKDKTGPINIVEMRGTDGSSPTEGRSRGFRDILNTNPRFQIVRSETGDFLRSRGRELMEQLLEECAATNTPIDVIYSHNDPMTFGILETLEKAGIQPGKDIVIVSIDAEQAALDALAAGKINCVVECNPHLGPQIIELAKILAAGGTIPKITRVNETIFTENDDLKNLPQRGY